MLLIIPALPILGENVLSVEIIKPIDGESTSGLVMVVAIASFTAKKIEGYIDGNLRCICYNTTIFLLVWFTDIEPRGWRNITVVAYDFNNNTANDSIEVYLMEGPPNQPSKPKGEVNCYAGLEYYYTSSSVDPNGDDVRYAWDWDGVEIYSDYDYEFDQWTDYYRSGEVVNISHSWSFVDYGPQVITVLSEDINGARSVFSNQLGVTIKNPLDIKISSGFGITVEVKNICDRAIINADWTILIPKVNDIRIERIFEGTIDKLDVNQTTVVKKIVFGLGFGIIFVNVLSSNFGANALFIGPFIKIV